MSCEWMKRVSCGLVEIVYVGGGRVGRKQHAVNREQTSNLQISFFSSSHSNILDVSASSSSSFFGYHLLAISRPQATLLLVAIAIARLVPNTMLLTRVKITADPIFFVCYLSTRHRHYPQSVVYATFRYEGDPLRISFP